MPKVIYDNILGKLREGAQVGPAGPQGPKGDTGAAGPAGPQGEQGGRREKTVQSVLLVYRDRRATRAIRDRKELSDRLDLREKPVLRDRRATRAIREQRHGKVSRTSRNLLLLRPESPRQALYMSVTKSGPLPEAVSGMSALPRNMGYSPAMTAVHSISW